MGRAGYIRLLILIVEFFFATISCFSYRSCFTQPMQFCWALEFFRKSNFPQPLTLCYQNGSLGAVMRKDIYAYAIGLLLGRTLLAGSTASANQCCNVSPNYCIPQGDCCPVALVESTTSADDQYFEGYVQGVVDSLYSDIISSLLCIAAQCISLICPAIL